MTYYGLFALQHRGQESCGIAVNNHGVVSHYKDMGLVGDVFNDEILTRLSGQMAIGHVRYSTTGQSTRQNAQPLVTRYIKGSLSIAHNGNLTNAGEIRHQLEMTGSIFQTTVDTEVLAYVIARERLSYHSIEEAVQSALQKIEGSFSLLVMSPRKLIAARDPFGIRPLCIGKLGGSTVIASESCALDAVGAEFVRDVKPGEIVVIGPEGMKSLWLPSKGRTARCIFEYIYFARPDSIIDGVSVYESRLEAGRLLAKSSPAEADIVVGVPDSGLDAAIGYSEQSGIPYAMGFVKNNYVGRTFIKPQQNQRESGVNIKLNALSHIVGGKRVVMIDDSIVRGTTCTRIVRMLRKAGASEVHVRISSPPFMWPCYYGTDIPDTKYLTAQHYDLEGIRELIGANSLAYLKATDLGSLIGADTSDYCDGCFTGNHPTKPPEKPLVEPGFIDL